MPFFHDDGDDDDDKDDAADLVAGPNWPASRSPQASTFIQHCEIDFTYHTYTYTYIQIYAHIHTHIDIYTYHIVSID